MKSSPVRDSPSGKEVEARERNNASPDKGHKRRLSGPPLSPASHQQTKKVKLNILSEKEVSECLELAVRQALICFISLHGTETQRQISNSSSVIARRDIRLMARWSVSNLWNRLNRRPRFFTYELRASINLELRLQDLALEFGGVEDLWFPPGR